MHIQFIFYLFVIYICYGFNQIRWNKVNKKNLHYLYFHLDKMLWKVIKFKN